MPVEGNEGMTYASRNLFATASRCVISWSRTWPVIELGQRLRGFIFTEISLGLSCIPAVGNKV